MYKAGAFFVGLYPPGSGKQRRFILLTDEEQGQAVWVYVSTTTLDKTCQLLPGCHPEITLPCWAVYEEAEIISTDGLRAAVLSGALVECAPLPSDQLSAVQEGLFESDETRSSVVRYCTDRM